MRRGSWQISMVAHASACRCGLQSALPRAEARGCTLKRAPQAIVLLFLIATTAHAGTVALWLFDEPEQLYPSSILNDASGNGLVIVLGRGARLAKGHFGRALEPSPAEPLNISGTVRNPQFGLTTLAVPPG